VGTVRIWIKERQRLVEGAMFLLLIAVILVGFYSPNVFITDKSVMVHIDKDMTGQEIGARLHEKGLIFSPLFFRAAAVASGNSTTLKEGYYQIKSRLSMHELLQKLQTGQVMAIKVVIPEGYTIPEIAKKMEQSGLMKSEDFLVAARKYPVPYLYMKNPVPVNYHEEGFLFPDTYYFPLEVTPNEVISVMLKSFDEKLTPAMREKISEKGWTIYQFVTLAALVEKEAKYDEDRPIIAAVFEKRLKIGMPLQTDASLQYILAKPKPELTIADTRLPSTYNTYLYVGLPPGPIANPGMASMKAVLEAKDTDYLYFVADSTGHYHYSKTYGGHLEAIEEINS